jgi:hypothetical protein
MVTRLQLRCCLELLVQQNAVQTEQIGGEKLSASKHDRDLPLFDVL